MSGLLGRALRHLRLPRGRKLRRSALRSAPAVRTLLENAALDATPLADTYLAGDLGDRVMRDMTRDGYRFEHTNGHWWVFPPPAHTAAPKLPPPALW